MTKSPLGSMKEFWIHAGELENLEDDWFHKVNIASKNLWDAGQVIHVIDYSEYEKLASAAKVMREALESARQTIKYPLINGLLENDVDVRRMNEGSDAIYCALAEVEKILEGKE